VPNPSFERDAAKARRSSTLRYVLVRRGLADTDKIENLDVESVFNSCPKRIRQKIMLLRQLVLDTASESEDVGTLEETLNGGSQVISRRMKAQSE